MDDGQEVVERNRHRKQGGIKRLVRWSQRYADHVNFRNHPKRENHEKNDLCVHPKGGLSKCYPFDFGCHGTGRRVRGLRRDPSIVICATDNSSASNSTSVDKAEL